MVEHSHKVAPAARTERLVTTTSGDEVLAYDQDVHHIHHLNNVAARVWNLCDGQRTVATIATEAGLAEDTVIQTLGKLVEAKLLSGDLPFAAAPRQSRRSLMRKAAIAGAIPVIVSVTAPLAASAQSAGTSCANNLAYVKVDESNYLWCVGGIWTTGQCGAGWHVCAGSGTTGTPPCCA